MTKEELREHCERQIRHCEIFAHDQCEEPSGNIYEEHKLVLELLEQESVLDKIRAEIEELDGRYVIGDYGIYGENIPKYVRFCDVVKIIDKYKAGEEYEDN